MMFPRLRLLSEFLQDDGVVIVSIDDFEAYRLRSIMDEVFGPRNFIAQLVWDKTRKNDAKLFSVGHEYLLVYAKSLPRLRELKTVWREQKPGATAIIAKWQELKSEYGDDFASIQLKLRDWYRNLPAGNPSKKLSRYKWVDKWGPWRDRDISWPGGGGPRYDVRHPETHLPCLVPEAGWRFAKPEEMQRQIDLGLVQFRDDHTEPPFRKAHLLPVPEELEADQSSPNDDEDGDQEEGTNGELAGLQVMPSVIYKQAQVSVKLLRKLFDGRKVFPNPKDHEILMRLFRYITGPNDLILDAFAGSGSTAHAVLQLNKEESSNRRFILIEMNEKIATEITAERIKRVMRGHAGLPALGGSFRYCTITDELFNCDGQVSDKVKFSALAQHVYFTETGEPLSTSVDRKRSPFIGVCNGTAYYLLFNGILGDKSANGGNILTTALLRELPAHDGPKVIFGEGCRLGIDTLKRKRITFKQIPYEIKVS
jgi:adenine-specific DNA-methyltransferase